MSGNFSNALVPFSDSGNFVINDDLYVQNQARINQLQEYLDSWRAMNQEGHHRFNEVQVELAKRVEEGERAGRLLEALHQNSTNSQPMGLAAPGVASSSQVHLPPVTNYSQYQVQSQVMPTATIEEITSHNQRTNIVPSNTPISYMTRGRQESALGQPVMWHKQLRTYPNGSQQGLVSLDQDAARRIEQQRQYNQSIHEQWKLQHQLHLNKNPPIHQQLPLYPTPTPSHPQQSGPPQYSLSSRPQLPSQPQHPRPLQQSQHSQQSQQPQQHSRPCPQQEQPRGSHQLTVPVENPQEPQLHINTPALPIGLPSYYRDHVLGHPGQQAVSNSSSLAGALGQTVQTTVPSSTQQQPNRIETVVEQNTNTIIESNEGAPQALRAPALVINPADPSTRDGVVQSALDTSPSIVIASTQDTTASSFTVPNSGGILDSETFRKHALRWATTAPPSSFLDVPQTHYKLFKYGNSNKIFLVIPDGKGGYIAKDPHNLDAPLSNVSIPSNNTGFGVFQDSDGNFQFLQKPLTPAQAQRYRPYTHPQAQRGGTVAPPAPPQQYRPYSSHQPALNALPPSAPPPTRLHYGADKRGINPNSFSTPTSYKAPSTQPANGGTTHPARPPPARPYIHIHNADPTSLSTPVSVAPTTQTQNIPRLPAQVDKTRLAKDVLRALGFSSGQKRPRPDELPASTMRDGGAKRQALDTDMTVAGGKVVDPVKDPDHQDGALVAATPAVILPETTSGGEEMAEDGVNDRSNSVGPTHSGSAQAIATPSKSNPSPDSNILLPPAPQRTPLTPSALPAQPPPPQRSALFDSIPLGSSSAPNPVSVSTQGYPHNIPQQPIHAPQSTSPSRTPTPNLAEVIELSDDTDNEPQAKSLSSRVPTPPPLTPPPPFHHPESVAKVQKTPLFLPSPPSSPSRMSLGGYGNITQGDDVYDGNMDESMAHGGEDQNQRSRYLEGGSAAQSVAGVSLTHGKKRPQVYVLVPPLPEYVIQEKRRKARQAANRKSRSRATKEGEVQFVSQRRTGARGGDEDVGIDAREDSTNANAAAEQAAVKEALSRIRERPCKWRGCDAVLNSAEKLSLHLRQHRWKQYVQFCYPCFWFQCGRRFANVDTFMHHLRGHARSPIFCAFQDCDESFRTPRQLLQHNIVEHRNSFLRMSSDPFRPVMPPSLPSAPEVLPSYMAVPRAVTQASISKDRHTLLGEWVLRNIFGPVNMGSKKHNAAAPLRTSRQDTGTQSLDAAQREYDFLVSRPSKLAKLPKMPDFEDLNSGEVSQLANDGMVLWHVGDLDDEVGDNAQPASDPGYNEDVEPPRGPDLAAEQQTVVVKEEGLEGDNGGIALSQPLPVLEPTSDEETVESMLTGI